jgi:tetratricopeptide (TPR) repeat protein
LTGLNIPDRSSPQRVSRIGSTMALKVYAPAFLGLLMAAIAVLILPNRTLISDAIKEATTRVQATTAPSRTVTMTPKQRLAALTRRFDAGSPLKPTELQDLLTGSVSTANAPVLLGIAAQLDRVGLPSTSSRTAYEILASGRPAVARAFLDGRPDKDLPELWRLGLELRRSSGDVAAAQAYLSAAATKPGAAPEKDLIEAAYELQRPDVILTAAEHGTISKLDRKTSLDLARRAMASSQFALIPRIDRAGTPEWRQDDPWLAMTLAIRDGQTQEALHYAALLPSGREQAREAIITASGDKAAMRALFLEQAQQHPSNRPAIAQRMLEAGLRPDSIALLRDQAAGLPPTDPTAQRLLYLMGPRPDAANLQWLRARADADPAWLKIYTERDRPSVALAYAEGHHDQNTDMLLLRLQLASAARDRTATNRALGALLVGWPLTPSQVKMATALTPSDTPKNLTIALAKARISTGTALPGDNLDLAWDAYDRGDFGAAAGYLEQQLKANPDDRRALLLMANVVEKQRGPKAAKPWLERALAQSPPNSQARLELLERLHRYHEAVDLVEQMRAQAPGDKKLEIIQARLLVATGHPGDAQRMLQP